MLRNGTVNGGNAMMLSEECVIQCGAIQKSIESAIGVIYASRKMRPIYELVQDKKRFSFEHQTGLLGKLPPVDSLRIASILPEADLDRAIKNKTLLGLRVSHYRKLAGINGVVGQTNLSRVKQALVRLNGYETAALEFDMEQQHDYDERED